jgi:hypothetical protein
VPGHRPVAVCDDWAGTVFQEYEIGEGPEDNVAVAVPEPLTPFPHGHCASVEVIVTVAGGSVLIVTEADVSQPNASVTVTEKVPLHNPVAVCDDCDGSVFQA